MPIIDLPADEYHALIDVFAHAPRVDWHAYDRARLRILHSRRSPDRPLVLNENIPPKELEHP